MRLRREEGGQVHPHLRAVGRERQGAGVCVCVSQHVNMSTFQHSTFNICVLFSGANIKEQVCMCLSQHVNIQRASLLSIR